MKTIKGNSRKNCHLILFEIHRLLRFSLLQPLITITLGSGQVIYQLRAWSVRVRGERKQHCGCLSGTHNSTVVGMWWTKLRGNRFPFYSNFQSTNYGGGCGSGGGKRRRIKHASVSSPGPTIHRLEKRSEFSCQGHLRSRYGISNCLMDSNKNVGNGSVQQIRMLHLQNGQTPLSEAIPSDLSYQVRLCLCISSSSNTSWSCIQMTLWMWP